MIIALLTFVGFIVPDSMLNSTGRGPEEGDPRTLSDTLDLLTISVEAGLSLNAAIAMVVRNVPGVLSQEFARMLQEIQLGVPRSDAFRHLAERTDVDELNAFALAMVQADVFGVSIASVLRTQAAQLRIKRRQAIEAKAAQTPGQDRVPADPVHPAGPVRGDRRPRRDPDPASFINAVSRTVGAARRETSLLRSGAMKVAYQGEPGAYSERAVRAPSRTRTRCRATRCGSCSRG